MLIWPSLVNMLGGCGRRWMERSGVLQVGSYQGEVGGGWLSWVGGDETYGGG